MDRRFRSAVMTLLAILLVVTGSPWPAAIQPTTARAAGPYTFTGRWGSTHSMTWDTTTYQAVITADDSLFPWDFISFVGLRGAVSLCGNPNVADAFAWSESSAIAGVGAGDLLRVKGRDAINLTHVSKLGLVIGSGATAQRSWISDGTIIDYTLAPDYVGYRAVVLGRALTVRLSQVPTGVRETVAVIDVSIDNPNDARFYFVSDLEPAVNSTYAIEFHNIADTLVSHNATDVLSAHNTTGTRADVYMYSASPVSSWSGSNQTFAAYLQTDVLDGQVLPTASDGRSAIVVQAQPRQFFYLGSAVLPAGQRSDPTPLMAELRDTRLQALHELPIIQSAVLPAIEPVAFLSGLLTAYLTNPDGNVWYSDRAFIYGEDSLMPLLVSPELLPSSWLASYTELMDFLGDHRYTNPQSWHYNYKFDTHNNPLIPAWYGGGIPSYAGLGPAGEVVVLGQWSDAYESGEYISALQSYLETSGDGAFVDTQQAAVLDALAHLQVFDAQYDAEYGEDGDNWPNVPMPMSSLTSIAGAYPGETATTIYAYRDAEQLLRRWGMNTEADDLANNYIAPMVAGFDNAFWDPALGFYTGIADRRSVSRAPGTRYQDKWCQAILSSLTGDLGQTHLSEALGTYVASGFYDSGYNVHWLSTDSESFAYPGRWGASPVWTNGLSMQGGFYDGLTGAVPPVGYYQLGQGALGDQYAAYYLDVWLTTGPYESMYEWNHRLPGRFIETSIYMEPLISTTWLIKKALGLTVDGLEVTIAPEMTGTFTVQNLHVTSNGLTAVIDYWRDPEGVEHITVLSNEGLLIYAPQVPPTAVELASFTATGYRHRVVVDWETVSEIDMLGFNLYRSDPGGGPPAMVNSSLIPARGPGGMGGFAYAYVDSATHGDQAVMYRLEIVHVYGSSAWYGPVPVNPATRYLSFLPLVRKGH